MINVSSVRLCAPSSTLYYWYVATETTSSNLSENWGILFHFQCHKKEGQRKRIITLYIMQCKPLYTMTMFAISDILCLAITQTHTKSVAHLTYVTLVAQYVRMITA